MGLWRSVCLTGCGNICWTAPGLRSTRAWVRDSCYSAVQTRPHGSTCCFLVLHTSLTPRPVLWACPDSQADKRTPPKILGIQNQVLGIFEVWNQQWFKRLVGYYVNLCGLVCLWTVMTGGCNLSFWSLWEFGCECMWDVPEDKFITQRLLFHYFLSWLNKGLFMVHSWTFSFVIQLFIQVSALSQMFLLKLLTRSYFN